MRQAGKLKDFGCLFASLCQALGAFNAGHLFHYRCYIILYYTILYYIILILYYIILILYYIIYM